MVIDKKGIMKGEKTMRIYANPLGQLRSEMDRLLGGFLGPTFDGILTGAVRGQPAVNVWDQSEELMLEMELPGAKNDQIDVK